MLMLGMQRASTYIWSMHGRLPMSALLAPLTWWPFSPLSPIQDVEPSASGPGLVNLVWSTIDPCPTELRSDGVVIYRDPTARTEHRVTLTGLAGQRRAIEILAHDEVRTVEVRF
jgi:hypothetical protein